MMKTELAENYTSKKPKKKKKKTYFFQKGRIKKVNKERVVGGLQKAALSCVLGVLKTLKTTTMKYLSAKEES
jgi:hypothetical protein